MIFRGKRLDNDEWLYGDLVHDDQGGCYVYPLDSLGLFAENKVDPDTVGQYTGMKDKHGKKVFEGDIVEVYDFTSVYANKYRGVVTIYRGSWCVEHEDFGMVFHSRLFFDDFADRKTEVIGNIYDNSELLSTE